jgi:NAD(P)-dependent dehydrogenase (short-subunit alcohol dehydrogenase family)
MALAFVTGASRGLGYEVAKALKARGDEVIGISKDRQRAEAASSELGIAFELMDCQQISQVRSVSGELLAKYGTPEILVLAHGVMSEKRIP